MAFHAFPVPVLADDVPLVTHAGQHYRCSGCGDAVPDGLWIFETVKDGMVVGLQMTSGGDLSTGARGTVVHQCGKP